MSNEQGSGAGTVLVAFMAGLAVGAAVALLVAPASGEETREFLADRAREGRDRLAEAARQGREAINRERDYLRTAFDRARQAGDAAVGTEPSA